MINSTPSETRQLGRYALRWNHITDWYKTNMRFRRRTGKNIPPAPIVEPVTPARPPTFMPASPMEAPLEAARKAQKSVHSGEKSQNTGKVSEGSARKDIKETVGASQEVIATATTVFPFTLFPDTISIDRTHVIIVRRLFFKVATIKNIRIDDIMTVSPSVGLLFGSLKLTVTFVDNESPYIINYLPRDEVLRMSRILKGYKLAREKEIDCSNLSNQELETLFNELSQDGTDV